MNILEHWMMNHVWITFFAGLFFGVFGVAIFAWLCSRVSDGICRRELHIMEEDEHTSFAKRTDPFRPVGGKKR